MLLVAGFLGAAASLTAGLVVLRPRPLDDRPVVLPATLAGLPAAQTGLSSAKPTIYTRSGGIRSASTPSTRARSAACGQAHS